MNKKAIWTTIIVIIILVGVWYFVGGEATPNENENNSDETATSTATTTLEVDEEVEENLGNDDYNSINDQLEGINIDDLEDEFDDMNNDIENL